MKFPPSITKKYVSAGRSPATTKPDIHLNNAELRDTHKRACLTNSKGKNELDFPPQKKNKKPWHTTFIQYILQRGGFNDIQLHDNSFSYSQFQTNRRYVLTGNLKHRQYSTEFSFLADFYWSGSYRSLWSMAMHPLSLSHLLVKTFPFKSFENSPCFSLKHLIVPYTTWNNLNWRYWELNRSWLPEVEYWRNRGNRPGCRIVPTARFVWRNVQGPWLRGPRSVCWRHPVPNTRRRDPWWNVNYKKKEGDQ